MPETRTRKRGKTGNKAIKPYSKKKGWSWKRIRPNPPQPKSSETYQAKQADWQMLKLWAELELINLKYLDESGFEKCSSLSYGYGRRGQQKRVYQPRKRGRRLHVLGFWQPQQSFEYGMMLGSVKSERYIQLMNWQAQKAASHLAQTGQITVMIQDNASSHKSKLVQKHWQQWQDHGLYLFFLPPYSPQMNRIEDEWLHIKYDELAAQMFEDEYEVALALIAAIEARGQKGEYSVQRYKFNHV